MPTKAPAWIRPVAGAIIIVAALAFGFMKFVNPYLPWQPDATLNPDPNHSHADFAIWIDGEKLDFSSPQYMSTPPAAGESATGAYMHQYLHLHDGIGHVMHRHKPGLTFGEFLRSIGVTFRTQDLNLCMTVPGRGEVCEDEVDHRNWVMIVNGVQQPFFETEYDFADMDKILVVLPQQESVDNAEAWGYWEQITDDACLYSRTCPWRGDPPAENCVADPEVPCIAPADDL